MVCGYGDNRLLLLFVRLFVVVVDNRLLFGNSFYLANLANRIV